MRSGVKIAIGFIIAALLLAGYGVYRYFDSKVIMNDGRVSGNTAGNLYGGGYFCQYGDKVYFSNPSDGGAIYVMDKNEGNLKKIINDKAYYINTDGNYIYYCRDSYSQESTLGFLKVNQNSLCRCKMDGSDMVILDEALSTNAVLCGNTIYYNHYDTKNATTLYSIGIDGSDQTMIEKSTANPCGIYNGAVYYAGVLNDHYLHKIQGNRIVTALAVPVWMPVLTGGNTVYSLDLDNGNRVCKIDMSNGTKTLVTPLKASSYNVQGNYVIYQTYGAEQDGLYIYDMSTDRNTIVVAGQYKDINVTDRYFYFKDYNTGATYHSTYAGVYAVFNPGK